MTSKDDSLATGARRGRLILVRHGQSVWNHENRFAGWIDVDLSDKGVMEARELGERLYRDKIKIDLAFSSVLTRAIRTLWLVQEATDSMYVPSICSWRLNERHYGALSGNNKAEMAEKFGADTVAQWRRGFRDRPPPACATLQSRLKCDQRYRSLPEGQFPDSESLYDTMIRAVQFWQERIRPHIQSGRTILISSHGNWIRMLVKHFDEVDEDRLGEIEIRNAVPIIYDFNESPHLLSR